VVVQDARDRSSSPGVPATRDRLPSLTGLRFWAALLVVLYHLTGQVGALQPVSAMTMFGRSGVTFFFVLSGFVLAWTYVDRPTRYRVFLWRRFARLWPLVVVTGVLSLLVFRAIGDSPGWWQAATTFLFLQAWHPDWAVGANGAAWSLSDEAFFYLAFPLLLALAVVRRRRVVLWGAAACLLVGLWLCFGTWDWSAWALDYLPLTRVVQFLVGVLCAVALRQGARAPLGYWWAVGLVIVYHAALVPWHLYGSATFNAYSGSQWWATPVFALLIMAAAQSDRDGRATGVRGSWSLRLGHWSYAWYLIHEVVIRAWTHLVPRSGATLLVAVEWGALLLLSLLAAGVLYRWVERPSERWLRGIGPQS
jgi:peptidoglycan/LPS O-acetylase OafA/YrhL